jgi:mono/diheme cytochrome c family protein
MLSRNLANGALAAVAVAALSVHAAEGQSTSPKPHFGKPISEADIAAWDIDVRTSDGKGLPKGKGSVAEGKALYDQHCAACHGEGAKGGPMYGTMVGGIGSFTTSTRILTPGSMYPYAAILFDYTRRTMPMTAPQSLTNDQVYALAAYILNLNGLVPDNAVMDAESLTKVTMPNRNGFIPDDRPDTQAKRCMTNC